MKLRTGLYLALVIPAIAFFNGYAANHPEGENQKIKDYVAGCYKELQDDLHQGDGASLTSLLSLLHTRSNAKDETIKRLRALSIAYPALSEFADRVPDFVQKDPATAVPSSPSTTALPVVSESDLVKLFGSMKYKTRIHLSLLNGDEIDGMFSSFDKSREIIWVYPAGSSSVFGKKFYTLQQMKNVSPIPH